MRVQSRGAETLEERYKKVGFESVFYNGKRGLIGTNALIFLPQKAFQKMEHFGKTGRLWGANRFRTSIWNPNFFKMRFIL